jgi:microcystin-dependent protein
MATPFLSEIKLMAFNFPPKGWALCNGQTLPINPNQALFSLLGTTYGGNGQTTFALPNLQSRVGIHQGQGVGLSTYTIGQVSGSENVTLTTGQMPVHGHGLVANAGTAGASRPDGAVLARTATNTYAASPDGTAMNAGAIGQAGGGQPHTNIQPFLCLNFCIALQGIFPSRN